MSENTTTTQRLIGAVNSGSGVSVQIRYHGLDMNLFLTNEQALGLAKSLRAEAARRVDLADATCLELEN